MNIHIHIHIHTQRLGRLHGCHHCGSRQGALFPFSVLSPQRTFIGKCPATTTTNSYFYFYSYSYSYSYCTLALSSSFLACFLAYFLAYLIVLTLINVMSCNVISCHVKKFSFACRTCAPRPVRPVMFYVLPISKS